MRESNTKFSLSHINLQGCSQGQNPKGKDEAKARTLKAKIKTRTLESKAKFKVKYDSQFNANIPHAIDMTIAPIS